MTKRIEDLIKMLKILYVDGGDISTLATQKILRKVLKDLLTAQNTKEGLEFFKTHKMDIIIINLKEPIQDKLTMIKEIRNFNQDCGVIIINELKEITITPEIIDIGIDKYIIKPLNEEIIEEALMVVIKKMLKRRTYEKFFANTLELNRDDKKKIEEDIKIEMSNFLKKCMGKGPRYVKVFISQDIVEIRAHEVLTSMEKTLIEDKNNLNLIEYNRKLFYKFKKVEIEQIISKAINKSSVINNICVNILEDEDIIMLEYF